MLEELKTHHAEVMRLIDELEQLTTAATPPVEALTATRSNLTRASRRRTQFLETAVFPHLLRAAAPTVRQQITALRDSGRERLLVSVQHIGRWSLREIMARWREYCDASRVMRRQMRERIAEERAILYPLLA